MPRARRGRGGLRACRRSLGVLARRRHERQFLAARQRLRARPQRAAARLRSRPGVLQGGADACAPVAGEGVRSARAGARSAGAGVAGRHGRICRRGRRAEPARRVARPSAGATRRQAPDDLLLHLDLRRVRRAARRAGGVEPRRQRRARRRLCDPGRRAGERARLRGRHAGARRGQARSRHRGVRPGRAGADAFRRRDRICRDERRRRQSQPVGVPVRARAGRAAPVARRIRRSLLRRADASHDDKSILFGRYLSEEA